MVDKTIAPYFDDFDAAKNFHQILFKPGLAVQTRELNQMQSILQNQIDKFGKHVFKEGSLVLGGAFDLEIGVDIVKVTLPPNANINNYIDKFVLASISGVKANIRAAKFDTVDNHWVFFIRYTSSTDGYQKFVQNDILTVPTTSFTATVLETPTEVGSMFTIHEGVIYTQGYFVQFLKQTVVLDLYNPEPTYTVGFLITQSVVTYNEDETLLDNAQNSFNYAAPGADRLMIRCELQTIEYGSNNDNPNFINLANIKSGKIETSNENTQYSELMEELAKRTFDESGDYYVNGFAVRTREHLDTGINEGYLLDADGGDADAISVDIEPGTAYVKGYEVNHLVTQHIKVPKSNTFKVVNNEPLSIPGGGFIIVNEVTGSPVVDTGTAINLYTYAGSIPLRVTDSIPLSTAISGATVVGTARVKAVIRESGELGTPSGRLRIYLYDIIMTTAAPFSAIEVVGISGTFVANIVLDGGKAILYNSAQGHLLVPVANNNVKAIKDKDGLSDTSYIYSKTQTLTATSGVVTVTVGGAGETLPYSITSDLGSIEKRDIFVTRANGTHIDLTTAGKLVSVTTSTSMTIDLDDSGINESVVVTYKISRNEAIQISKILRPSRYVKINCSAFTLAELKGPLSLGVADVFRIRSIRGKNTAFTAADEGFDVTRFFNLVTRQTDNYYDHSAIQATKVNLTTSNYLLVEFDYFEPNFSQGRGYFSIDSYPIDDDTISNSTIFTYEIPKYVSSSGQIFDLRNTLDFRAVKTPGNFNDATTVAAAIVNPTASSTFYEAASLRMPAPSTTARIDYSYYLARRDIITLDKNGNFNVINGDPDIRPISPKTSENVMPIASVYIPPYPSISESLGRIIGETNTCISEQIAHKRHTQREIGVLKQRIENLEYYNTLNMLERSVAEYSIKSDSNPDLDRFKNGFFVDPFIDHSLGDTENKDYNICIDTEEQSIRPVFNIVSSRHTFNTSRSENIQRTGDILSLPYEETVLISQNNATTTRNVNESLWRFVGDITLQPDNDIWVDTNTVDKSAQFGNMLPSNKVMTSDWRSWEKYVTGQTIKTDNTAFSSTADVISNSRTLGTSSKTQSTSKTTVSTVSTSGRTGGIKSPNTSTTEMGTYVTDNTVTPYIRPMTIGASVTGLKPNQRHYIFFDGENMGEWATLAATWNAGSPIKSNADGDITMFFMLPADSKRFRIGTKEVVITDSPTNSPTATSYAKTYFLASGLTVHKQNSILSTRAPHILQQEEVFDVGSKKPNKVGLMGASAIAYTFGVNTNAARWWSPTTTNEDESPEGAFITSVEIFLRQKGPYGCGFEIREVTPGGQISKSVVPYSKVWYKKGATQFKVSPTGTLSTKITFPAPVFLYDSKQYAFVITPELMNPDMYVFTSVLGQTDLITNERITTRSIGGNLFTTNNSVNWTIVPDTDLKIIINRASFDTNVVGTAVMGNQNNEYFEVDNIVGSWNQYGEEVRGSDKLILSGLAGQAIAIGNTIIGGTSNTSATVLDISGTVCYTSGFTFVQGESITITGKDTTGIISSIEHGMAYLNTVVTEFPGSDEIQNVNNTTTKLELTWSNGRFFTGALLKGLRSTNTATISNIVDSPYSVTTIKPNYLNFNKTACTFRKRGIRKNELSFDTVDNGWTLANPDSITVSEKLLTLQSRSQEINNANLIGIQASSAELEATLTTTSNYISPIIDISRASTLYVNNIINSISIDDQSELKSVGGDLINTYVSKTISLADGQDAEDLIVRLSMYRPINSDVRVWAKLLHNDDPQSIEEREWILLENTSPHMYSSAVNQNDFIESMFKINADNLTNDVFNYESDDIVYSGYKHFVIKIGLVGTNSALVPRVADLRAIALQV